MGAAVRQKAVTQFLQDLLVFGEGMDTAERVVRSEEAGRKVSDFPELRDALILGVARGEERCPFHKLKDFPLQAGDIVVYIMAEAECTRSGET